MTLGSSIQQRLIHLRSSLRWSTGHLLGKVGPSYNRKPFLEEQRKTSRGFGKVFSCNSVMTKWWCWLKHYFSRGQRHSAPAGALQMQQKSLYSQHVCSTLKYTRIIFLCNSAVAHRCILGDDNGAEDVETPGPPMRRCFLCVCVCVGFGSFCGDENKPPLTKALSLALKTSDGHF